LLCSASPCLSLPPFPRFAVLCFAVPWPRLAPLCLALLYSALSCSPCSFCITLLGLAVPGSAWGLGSGLPPPAGMPPLPPALHGRLTGVSPPPSPVQIRAPGSGLQGPSGWSSLATPPTICPADLCPARPGLAWLGSRGICPMPAPPDPWASQLQSRPRRSLPRDSALALPAFPSHCSAMLCPALSCYAHFAFPCSVSLLLLANGFAGHSWFGHRDLPPDLSAPPRGSQLKLRSRRSRPSDSARALLALPCLALPCLALLCLAWPGLALLRFAWLCFAVACLGLPWLRSRGLAPRPLHPGP
jgi:hypothetical protein